jgi:hypothetical protein
MDEEIHELRSKKFTIEEIAEKLGITVGQVKYRLYKKSTAQLLNGKPSTPTEPIRQENGIDQTSKTSLMEIPAAPQFYGENVIAVIVQGPTAIYVYWEITWPLSGMVGDFLKVPFESLPRLLRIYDVTDIWFNGNNEHWYRDIEINGQADDWFVHDLMPGRTYILELGISWQGRFLPIMRSKPKSTPWNQPVFARAMERPILSTGSNERVKPQWFENFCTYTLY